MLATAILLVAAAATASLLPALRALRASATGGLSSLRGRT